MSYNSCNQCIVSAGIPQESLIKVKESLAFSANKRIFSNILATKDAMSPSDIQQFASIKDSLKIDNAVYQQLNYNSSRLAVLEHGRKIFGAPAKGTITAAIASRFRQQVRFISQCLFLHSCYLSTNILL